MVVANAYFLWDCGDVLATNGAGKEIGDVLTVIRVFARATQNDDFGLVTGFEICHDGVTVDSGYVVGFGYEGDCGFAVAAA